MFVVSCCVFVCGLVFSRPSKANVELVKQWIIQNYRTDDWLEVETVEEFAKLILNAYNEGIEFEKTNDMYKWKIFLSNFDIFSSATDV